MVPRRQTQGSASAKKSRGYSTRHRNHSDSRLGQADALPLSARRPGGRRPIERDILLDQGGIPKRPRLIDRPIIDRALRSRSRTEFAPRRFLRCPAIALEGEIYIVCPHRIATAENAPIACHETVAQPILRGRPWRSQTGRHRIVRHRRQQGMQGVENHEQGDRCRHNRTMSARVRCARHRRVGPPDRRLGPHPLRCSQPQQPQSTHRCSGSE